MSITGNNIFILYLKKTPTISETFSFTYNNMFFMSFRTTDFNFSTRLFYPLRNIETLFWWLLSGIPSVKKIKIWLWFSKISFLKHITLYENCRSFRNEKNFNLFKCKCTFGRNVLFFYYFFCKSHVCVRMKHPLERINEIKQEELDVEI